MIDRYDIGTNVNHIYLSLYITNNVDQFISGVGKRLSSNLTRPIHTRQLRQVLTRVIITIHNSLERNTLVHQNVTHQFVKAVNPAGTQLY